MNKIKLMTIVGTRPEVIKLSETIKKCDIYFEHILVHTGQNYDYELNQVFFEELEIRKPDFYLNVANGNLGQVMGNVIQKSYQIMLEQKPDALLILGDTNSCLSAISAKRLKIPVFHMEAGNRCFDENLPEEINRRIVDHISDVNLCYTQHAKNYLNWEGISKERTFVIGSPMSEIFNVYKSKINESQILKKLSLERKKYFLLSAHREENIDNEITFFSLMNSINAVSKFYNLPIIYSVHPRSRKFIEERNFVFDGNVVMIKPLSFFDYNFMQKNSMCVISDSGTLAEEASYFKFPAVSIRTSTERPEVLDKGNMIIGGISEKSLNQSIEMAININKSSFIKLDVPDYIDENVSIKIIKIIQSYTNIVNTTVWRK